MKEIDVIQRQLDRVLNFFPRVEARINGLFGVNTLMFALTALNVSVADLRLWYVTVPGAAVLAGLVTSYAFLFKANFPEERGGEGSLIYFKRIRERTEATYLSELLACSDEEFRKDLIGQIWRNSDILCLKFGWVKKAIIATALSLVPFIIFLATTAAIHDRIPVFKG
ncbi:MAG TPA: Pycsar system effector family protein [Allosphingosinicella sp.]|jgi:hypothetical protein